MAWTAPALSAVDWRPLEHPRGSRVARSANPSLEWSVSATDPVIESSKGTGLQPSAGTSDDRKPIAGALTTALVQPRLGGRAICRAGQASEPACYTKGPSQRHLSTQEASSIAFRRRRPRSANRPGPRRGGGDPGRGGVVRGSTSGHPHFTREDWGCMLGSTAPGHVRPIRSAGPSPAGASDSSGSTRPRSVRAGAEVAGRLSRGTENCASFGRRKVHHPLADLAAQAESRSDGA